MVKRPVKKRACVGALPPRGACVLHLTWIVFGASGLLSSDPTRHFTVTVHSAAGDSSYLLLALRADLCEIWL